MLNACLASLHVQTVPGQLIVTCNATVPETTQACWNLCELYGARYLPTGYDGALNCYQAANLAHKHAYGDWLCFPSDDSLYAFEFAEIMLDAAGDADLVYCDCVYRQDPEKGKWPKYKILETRPNLGMIDKTTFIVRRELFAGFPRHEHDWCDGALIDELIAAGAKAVKAPGALVIHQ